MSGTKKNLAIRYTSRDFNSIKQDLVEYAKRYYPDTFQDFSEASFGALMVDTVAYVGDILSFYLDYQANECFLDSAVEYNNVIRLGKQLGYKFRSAPSSHGIATLYILAPAADLGLGPNTAYLPILKKGSTFETVNGNMFTLSEDVDFANTNNEIVVANVNSTTGIPTSYAVKASGRVMSGELRVKKFTVGNFQKFLRLEIPGRNTAEIVSVIDSEGHAYYEVDYLSQNTVYAKIPNLSDTEANTPNILKPVIVARRFVIDREKSKTFIQFGYGSDSELKNLSIADPANLVLQRHGKSYITDVSVDPGKLTQTDKFGIAPSNTTLTVIYRQNTSDGVNASSNSLTKTVNPSFRFTNTTDLTTELKNFVMSSLEITNEEPITGDITLPNTTEVKRRITDTFAAQNRAVTKNDYRAIVYAMPGEFGAIKRCTIVQDPDSFKRNLNMYLISENTDGTLIPTNSVIKENLKTWLNRYKMINDTVDILDAKIVNLGIDFEILTAQESNKFETLNAALRALRRAYENHYEISEPFSIAEIYRVLNTVPGVADTLNVRVYKKAGGVYASNRFNVTANLTPQGRQILAPENVIFEVKFPNADIKGTVV
jgi:hypothetical protein